MLGCLDLGTIWSHVLILCLVLSSTLTSHLCELPTVKILLVLVNCNTRISMDMPLHSVKAWLHESLSLESNKPDDWRLPSLWLVLWFWKSCLASLSLSILTCRMRSKTLIPGCYWNSTCVSVKVLNIHRKQACEFPYQSGPLIMKNWTLVIWPMITRRSVGQSSKYQRFCRESYT